MEIRPHPNKKNRAIITVDSPEEEAVVDGRVPFISMFSIRAYYQETLDDFRIVSGKGDPLYPRDLNLSYRELGHVAGKSLYTYPLGLRLKVDDRQLIPHGIELVGQITEFFEERAVEKASKHPVSPEAQTTQT